MAPADHFRSAGKLVRRTLLSCSGSCKEVETVSLGENNEENHSGCCCHGGGGTGRRGRGRRGRSPHDDGSRRPASGCRWAGSSRTSGRRRSPACKVQSLPGAGIANVRAIEEGKAEVGFANTITTADAVAGTGEAPLDKKHDKVCNVATLYPQYFQVVVQRRQRHQHDQGRQGQGLRHPGQGQHRRADRAPRAAGVGHDLQRREGRASPTATPTASSR